MRFRQVLAVGAFALVEVGHGIQPHPVHAHRHPEFNDIHQAADDIGAVEIQIRLMMIEAMPEVLIGDRIPRPIRRFEIFEDDPRVFVLIGKVIPDVEVSRRAPGLGAARTLKPGMLVRCVIQHQFGYDTNAAPMRFAQKYFEIGKRSI